MKSKFQYKITLYEKDGNGNHIAHMAHMSFMVFNGKLLIDPDWYYISDGVRINRVDVKEVDLLYGQEIKRNKQGIWISKDAQLAVDRIFKEQEDISYGINNGWEQLKRKQDEIQMETDSRKKALANHDLGKGKCPLDDRIDRLVYILLNNKETLAITDGMGNAYKIYGDSYMGTECKCLPENRYDPSQYEFKKFLSGMDF